MSHIKFSIFLCISLIIVGLTACDKSSLAEAGRSNGARGSSNGQGSATGDISGANTVLRRAQADADYKIEMKKCTEQSGPARETRIFASAPFQHPEIFMKRLFAIAFLAAVTAPTLTTARSSDYDNPTGFYTGLGYGQFDLNVRNLDGVTSAVSSITRSNNNAWRVFVGYRALPYLAFEGAYVDFGRARDQFTATGSNGNYRVALSGFAPAVVLTAPLGPVEVFAKASYYFYDVDTRINFDSPAPGTNAGIDSSDSGSSFAYGGGLGFTFAERFNLRAEYETIKIRNADSSDAVWLSASFRF
jgi:opacity protein-like surface antigen